MVTKNTPSPTPTPETLNQPTDLVSAIAAKMNIPKETIKKLEDKDGKILDAKQLNMSSILLWPTAFERTSAIAKMLSAAQEFVGFAEIVGTMNGQVQMAYWTAILEDREWASFDYLGYQPGGGALGKLLATNLDPSVRTWFLDNAVTNEVAGKALDLFNVNNHISRVACLAKATEIVAEQQNMTVAQNMWHRQKPVETWRFPTRGQYDRHEDHRKRSGNLLTQVNQPSGRLIRTLCIKFLLAQAVRTK